MSKTKFEISEYVEALIINEFMKYVKFLSNIQDKKAFERFVKETVRNIEVKLKEANVIQELEETREPEEKKGGNSNGDDNTGTTERRTAGRKQSIDLAGVIA